MIGSRGNGSGAHTNFQSGIVHHLEHIGQSSVFFTHQVSCAIVFFSHAQSGNGGSPISKFVEHLGDGYIILEPGEVLEEGSLVEVVLFL